MGLPHKGHFKTNFLNEIKLCFSFPFSLGSFFFSAFFSFYVFIYSYKNLDLGMTNLTSWFIGVATKGG